MVVVLSVQMGLAISSFLLSGGRQPANLSACFWGLLDLRCGRKKKKNPHPKGLRACFQEGEETKPGVDT